MDYPHRSPVVEGFSIVLVKNRGRGEVPSVQIAKHRVCGNEGSCLDSGCVARKGGPYFLKKC